MTFGDESYVDFYSASDSRATYGATVCQSLYSAKKLRRVLEILCGAFQRCSRIRL